MNSISRSKSIVMSQTSREELFPSPPGISKTLSGLYLDAQTRELLHHYITTVSISIAGNREPKIWLVSVPQLGLEYPFVLSSMLAISALHLATLLPQRQNELQNSAIMQESAAMPSFRASFDNPDTESIHAIFAFAGSLVYYILALPEDAGRNIDRCRIPSRYEEYPHWFQAIRGFMALLSNYWDDLTKGPFAPLLHPDSSLGLGSENTDDRHLAKLDEMLEPPPLEFYSSQVHLSQDLQKLKVCKGALIELRRIFALLYLPSRPYGEALLRVWLGNVSQEFVELIYERDPRALVIMAHYCVLCKRSNHVWYLKGLGSGLLENIRQALGDEWHPWIRWPIEQPTY
jgi:hypothetical protein